MNYVETYCKHCGTFKPDSVLDTFEHNFVHNFEDIQVNYNPFDGFDIDLTKIAFPSFDYPVKCSVENCSAHKSLHGQVIKHEFLPDNKHFYQLIKLIVPNDHLCFKCSKPLSEHAVSDHKFITKAVVKLSEPFNKVYPQFKLKLTDSKQNLLDVTIVTN
jgi:hypothetical protein